MATLLENEKTQENFATREAEVHNAQIRERYRRLAEAEERQFGEQTVQNATDYTVRASVLTPEKPAFTSSFEEIPTREQTPQITEFVRERKESPVFTTDKFNGVAEQTAVAQTTVTQTAWESPVTAQAPTAVAFVAQEAQYSLSRVAKIAMAVFTAVVVMMLSVICINTQIIQQKTLRLRNLEDRKAELVEKNEEIQRRINEAKSEEAILQYAESQGMIKK